MRVGPPLPTTGLSHGLLPHAHWKLPPPRVGGLPPAVEGEALWKLPLVETLRYESHEAGVTAAPAVAVATVAAGVVTASTPGVAAAPAAAGCEGLPETPATFGDVGSESSDGTGCPDAVLGTGCSDVVRRDARRTRCAW